MPADTRKEQIAREKTLHCKRNIVLYMYDLSVQIGNEWEFGKKNIDSFSNHLVPPNIAQGTYFVESP